MDLFFFKFPEDVFTSTHALLLPGRLLGRAAAIGGCRREMHGEPSGSPALLFLG